jgi:sulfatase modifying factor 1
MPRLCSSLLLSLLIASSASAVTMDWTFIGNPGNASDPAPNTAQCGDDTACGSVAYAYQIGTYEVTNAQYAEFLNAKAVSDPLALYNPQMGMNGGYGGITRTGTSGSYNYSTITGREDMPANFVNVWSAMRFANWMNNGQGNSDMNTGSYTLIGGSETEEPTNANTVLRNAEARIVLPSLNEWYKAAYYDPSTASYFAYPAGSNDPTSCAAPSAGANSANCGGAVAPPPSYYYSNGDVTIVGSYPGSASPYGTFDQGGNVAEWTDTLQFSYGAHPPRGIRGGGFYYDQSPLAANWYDYGTGVQIYDLGLRLVMIPEPSTGLLVVAGLLGLAGWRRVRA